MCCVCCVIFLIYQHVGHTLLKITEMLGCDAAYESDKEIKRMLEEQDVQNKKNPTKTAI